jgi:site-specific DNA recombinase
LLFCRSYLFCGRFRQVVPGSFLQTLREELPTGLPLAGARRALDRYFSAFEEGSLSAGDCQQRIARLRGRIDALEAEERALEEGASQACSEPPTAEDVAEWAQELPVLLEAAAPQQRKALMRLLVKELRVMSRDEIRPTYKVPPVVRTPDSQVVPTGFEPVSPP